MSVCVRVYTCVQRLRVRIRVHIYIYIHIYMHVTYVHM